MAKKARNKRTVKKSVKKTIKKKLKKRAISKKSKKQKVQRISFLTQRKNIHDKFFDLVQANIKTTSKNGKFKKTGIKELASKLEITPATLKRYITKGKINDKNDVLFINVERNFEKLKVKKTKVTTKQFTVHNFTFDNFFPKKFFKVKKNEQLYFRAGLYIVFQRIKKVSTGDIPNLSERQNMDYVIQNYPISHRSDDYPEGYFQFFETIKYELQNYPSILYFRFNYFDVTKVNLADY